MLKNILWATLLFMAVLSCSSQNKNTINIKVSDLPADFSFLIFDEEVNKIINQLTLEKIKDSYRNIAELWEMPNDTTLTITLKKDITLHIGQNINSKIAVNSLRNEFSDKKFLIINKHKFQVSPIEKSEVKKIINTGIYFSDEQKKNNYFEKNYGSGLFQLNKIFSDKIELIPFEGHSQKTKLKKIIISQEINYSNFINISINEIPQNRIIDILRRNFDE